jgi:tripartite-type tricarboxylate transporter receptor subunit TctC
LEGLSQIKEVASQTDPDNDHVPNLKQEHIQTKQKVMSEQTGHWLHGVAGLLCALLAAGAGAQTAATDWPNRPINIVTPFAPGGTDLAVRHYTNSISAEFPQWRFVYDYRQGAQGGIAYAHVAKSAPDGHTLAVTSTTLLLLEIMEDKQPYEEKDFSAVYLLTRSPQMFAVNAALPIKSMPEFIAYAKANPGKLNYAMIGSSGVQRLLGEYFQEILGVKFTFIPYKGTGPIGTAVMSGEVDATFQAPRNLIAPIKAGKVRGLAMSSLPWYVFPQLPNVRSMAESGAPAFEHFAWVALHAPAATPLPVRNTINRMFNAALKKPDLIKGFQTTGDTPGGGTIQEFEKYMDVQRDRWVGTARRLGIRLTSG